LAAITDVRAFVALLLHGALPLAQRHTGPPCRTQLPS
jgi:hypothetical protein